MDKQHLQEYLSHYHSYQTEFHQAVLDLWDDVGTHYHKRDDYQHAKLWQRLIEPDRVIRFRVTWQDDNNQTQVNRAWRVQHSNALGAYKGGLRFHPSVNESILKFLAFEQSFKDALTMLPMGGAKGGADFDPKGKSDNEVMRFCHALMDSLYHYIGEELDVPAGDIGVGEREISYLFGHYVKITRRFAGGVLTGKNPNFGGSCGREEATGYGVVYFIESMLGAQNDTLEQKRIAISGAGNVALFAAEKALAEGARVITLSDSDGTIYCEEGLDEEQLDWIKALKFERRGRLYESADAFSNISYAKGKTPWHIPCDIAAPCATQNELQAEDAKTLCQQGVQLVAEGANMPLTSEALKYFRSHKVLVAPAKACNAGGVAVSGLERTQNAQFQRWSLSKVEGELQNIMRSIHAQCIHHADQDSDYTDYVKAANLASFRRLADAVLAYGIY